MLYPPFFPAQATSVNDEPMPLSLLIIHSPRRASCWVGAEADARSVYIAKLIDIITVTSEYDLDSMSMEV